MPLSDFPIEPRNPEEMRRIEFELLPILPQNAPVNAAELFKAFEADCEQAEKLYKTYRFETNGIASKVQRDVHNKPSIELSDEINGRCYVLCVFNDPAILTQVNPGERVTVRGNYLAASNRFGVIIKNSEVVKR